MKNKRKWGKIIIIKLLNFATGAVFVAYIIGKVSYQRACQQKILEKIPNSNLAQAIRTNKGLRSPFDA